MKSLAAHLFLPHHSNNQRPKILHPQAVMTYVVIFFILQVAFRVGQFVYPDILGYATNITIDTLYSLTNQKRQEKGLSSLTLNTNLSTAAFQKAQDMFDDNYWSHVAPDGKTPWQFIEESGYVYLYAGENLAKDFADSQGVVSAWIASPTHKDNILKPEYSDVGFAVVNGNLNGTETTLVVQMFGKKKTLAEKPPLIPAKTAIAQTPPSLPPSPILTPAPTEIPATPTPRSTQASSFAVSSLEKTSLERGVTKKPLIDVYTLERKLSLTLIFILLSVLVVDGVIMLKRKTVRIAGHNIAHIIFLATLVGLVFLTKRGVIL